MLSRSDIIARLQAVLGQRPEVLDGYLFGSTARGNAQAHSDIDVAVYVDPEKASTLAPGYGYQAELLTSLMSALATNQVDLVILNDAPPVLYHRVLRDGVRLVSRELTATTVREGRALSRYCDYVPQLAKIEAAAKARLAQGKLGR